MSNKRLIRIGDCKRCGKCCFFSNLITAPAIQLTMSDEKRAAIHNMLAFEKISGSRIHCVHLEFGSDGLAICKIFGKPERPIGCSIHPNSPESLTKGCEGFTFVWEEINGS